MATEEDVHEEIIDLDEIKKMKVRTKYFVGINSAVYIDFVLFFACRWLI